MHGVDPISSNKEKCFSEVKLEQCLYWDWGRKGDCDDKSMPAFESARHLTKYLTALRNRWSSGSASSGGVGLVEMMVNDEMWHVSIDEYIEMWKYNNDLVPTPSEKPNYEPAALVSEPSDAENVLEDDDADEEYGHDPDSTKPII